MHTHYSLWCYIFIQSHKGQDSLIFTEPLVVLTDISVSTAPLSSINCTNVIMESLWNNKSCTINWRTMVRSRCMKPALRNESWFPEQLLGIISSSTSWSYEKAQEGRDIQNCEGKNPSNLNFLLVVLSLSTSKEFCSSSVLPLFTFDCTSCISQLFVPANCFFP